MIPRRPKSCNPRIEAVLFGRLAQGRSLRKICARRYMPNKSTILDWISTDKRLADQYARARELQAEALAEEIVDLSDKATDRDSAACAKVQVDARKWIAAKLLPKKYGEAKGDVNVSVTNNTLVISDETRQAMIEQQRRLQLS